MHLKGQVTLITGGARGIGKSIAEKFADNGSDLVIVDVNEDSAKETAAEMQKKGIKAIAIKADVSSADEVEAMFQKVVEEFGKIDILVNNAGVTRDNLLLRMKESEWDLVININLKGVFLCTKSAVKRMSKARSGNIVNVASIVGQMGNAGQANYTASKGGVIALTKTTAREFAARGIRANAVAPGFINTDMTKSLPEPVKEDMLSRIPVGKMGESEDIANAVLFLASPMSAYITGHVLSVNGGMLM
ncbi:MAG: 3-oxoacyl-[acyl-carrier-protein] reductase [Spirochaetes bacterium]|nr:3-oxoacyl-[acyl-carrier-protein] reductase [Spirochaetota bacterium]MCK5267776.1 3-oxoacyl-[acyl-carrier-protein] reductase [Spirochaetota bacterium]